MTSRWVIVDDTDSAIVYQGPWFADRGSLDHAGNFGAPYLSTSHGTNSTASFSYTFTGSRVLITGSSEANTPTTVSWECIVDSQPPSSIAVSGAENNLRLCEVDGLSDAPHLLTVTAKATNGGTFWLDYIKYLPSPSTSLANAAISIDSTDPGLNFDQGWKQFSPGFETSTTGSKLSFSFTGVSLLYYGFFDPSLPVDTSTETASYSIDGQSPVPFDVLLDSSSLTSNPAGVQYNSLLFSTGNLAAGPHTLNVMYLGTPQTSPLTFEFLVVQNGTSSPASPGVTSSAVSTGTQGISPPLGTSTLQGTSTVVVTAIGSTSSSSSTNSSGSTSSSLAPTTTPKSGGIHTHQSNPIAMLALAGVAVYYLCGRGARSFRF